MHDISKGDKQEVKRKLLWAMSKLVENMDLYYEATPSVTNMHFPYGWPEPFHASSGDKLIFSKLIDSVLDNIMSEDRNITNSMISCASILGRFYYPY